MFNFLHFVCAQWNPNKRSGMSSVSILSDGRMDIVICRGDFVPKSNKHFVRPWTKLVLTSLKISLILLVLDIIQTNPITKTKQIKQKQRDFSFLFIFFLFAHHHISLLFSTNISLCYNSWDQRKNHCFQTQQTLHYWKCNSIWTLMSVWWLDGWTVGSSDGRSVCH